jgi:hypothetical protein
VPQPVTRATVASRKASAINGSPRIERPGPGHVGGDLERQGDDVGELLNGAADQDQGGCHPTQPERRHRSTAARA